MTPDEFLKRESEEDGNLWWRLTCGEHQNLFEQAVEERDKLREALDLAEDTIGELR
jgi:hypothetical protein